MDSHCEPYRDEEDAGSSHDVLDNGAVIVMNGSPSTKTMSHHHHADEFSPSQMKPMSVATSSGDDLLYGNDRQTIQRKVTLATCISIIFLLLGWAVTDSEEYRKFVQEGESGSGHHHHHHHHSHDTDQCQGLDAMYFSELVARVESTEQEDLCVPDLAFHGCHCKNPFQPSASESYPGWDNVLQMNVDLLENNYSAIQPGLVLYGDSITEHLVGRNFGQYKPRYEEIARVTQQLLTRRGGGIINGLPMGISGDQIANLLYRLQNGEMPPSLHPKVWWILIGTNDLGMGCSIDTIVAGNIRIVQELRTRSTTTATSSSHVTLTPIVINSLLPRGKQEMNAPESMWRLLRVINQQLECYAKITPGVYFRNATDIFAVTHPGGTFLVHDYFDGDHLHPNVNGTRAWEEWMIEETMELIV